MSHDAVICSDGRAGSDIQEFYRDCSILVTGATGFMGKVLVEKLLRACPDISTIYLLMRTKRGKLLPQRLQELVESKCFDRLRAEHPDFQCKLVAVAGDIGHEGLGIDEQDRHLLAEHVNIVFHVAATLKFDEQLNVAVKQNVRATRDLLLMCKQFTKLKSFIYVSTAYSNCPSRVITEDFYEPPISSELAIKMAEEMEPSRMAAIETELRGRWPNSYSFSKMLAEDIVKTVGKDLPIGVFRPSIVVATDKEPVPGWIDNRNGPIGFNVGLSAGILRTMQGDSSLHADIVPCDMAINALIAAAWDIADARSRPTTPLIYNYISPTSNRFTWGDYIRISVQQCVDFPVKQAVWYPGMVTSRMTWLAQVYRFWLHVVPARLVDTGLVLTGNKPRMMAIYDKIHKYLELMTYFCSRSWEYRDDNVVKLCGRMSDKDREMFRCDLRELDVEKYMKVLCLGVRMYLMKEGLETLPQARRKARRLLWIHYAVITCILTLLAKGCSFLLPLLQRIYRRVMFSL